MTTPTTDNADNRHTLKARAATLLHSYDTMRKEMRTLERELHVAVREFAKVNGNYVGMTKDTFRLHLQMEQERLEQEAERDHWEKHNA